MYTSRLIWLFGVLFIFQFHPGSSQNIVINEFMADNESNIIDEDGDYTDWLELYNPGPNKINLNGYHLSDDKDEPEKWTFPNVEIESNEFLIIFASGKDKYNGSSIHTNFKISDEGEKLILSNSLEIKIDEFDKVELRKDETFGRLPDGSANKVILPYASPGGSNNSFNKLTFSHDGGFYDSGFDLSIFSLLGDSIYYTLDGSEPTTESLFYSSKLTLKDNSDAPNVWCEIPSTPHQDFITNPAWQSPGALIDKANIIRCASFKNGVKTSSTFSQTYFIADNIHQKYDLPVISLITDGNNFFDHFNGIYVPGAAYDINNPEWTGNYFIDEIESERPVHIEFYEKDGTQGFSQNAGVRIHGGKTRHAAQKSLKLYARNEYGDKYFRYPLMPQNGVEKYERFLLQATMSAWGGDTVIKDILAHEITRNLNMEKMDYQPVVVFLNGEYWGIHHIRDRIDEEYLSYTTGLDKDSVEIDRVGNGHFNNLINYFKDHVPIDNEEYEYISTQMDIDAFIDYNIGEMFLNNYDWPANNSRHWRPKKPDGIWRWIFFDIDGGFNDYTYDMLEHNTKADSTIIWPYTPKSTFFFRSLIAHDIFLEKFLERYKFLIANDFRSSITKSKLNILIDKYKYEMPHHITRWHFPATFNSWLEDIDHDIVDFLDHRACAVKDHLIEFFDLEDYDVECKDDIDVKVEHKEKMGISISPNPSNGQFSFFNSSPNKRSLNIKVYNSLGELIHQSDNLTIEASQLQHYSLNDLPSGIYALSIQHDDIFSTLLITIAKN